MTVPCPNPDGKCSRCGATEATAFYGKKGSKYCKFHYDADQKENKDQAAVAAGAGGSKRAREEQEMLPASASGLSASARISEIYSITNERYLPPDVRTHLPYCPPDPMVAKRCGRGVCTGSSTPRSCTGGRSATSTSSA